MAEKNKTRVNAVISDNGRLIASAAKLITAGRERENTKAELARLVEKGISYEAPEMKAAYTTFVACDERWKALEQKHLALRKELRLSKYDTDSL